MTTWDSVALGDLCSLITDGKHGDCADAEDSGYYFISAKDVRDGSIHYKSARQIRESDFAETHRRTDLQPGDVLVTNSGTIGRLAIASHDELTSRTTFQKSVAILKPRTNRVTSPFLYYSLAANAELLTNAAGGAAQKNLLLGDLRRLAISVPSLNVQAQITETLSTYDDLIENNRRRMALLEDSARLLYREWFVRLRFPGYEHTPIVDGVPQGWAQVRVDDFGTVLTGKTPATKDSDNYGGNIPFVKTPDMHGHAFVLQSETYLTEKGAKCQANKFLPPGSLLVSCIGTVGVVSLTSELCQFNQQINAVIPNEGFLRYYCYFAFKDLKPRLDAIGGGVTMANVSKGKFESMDLLRPSAPLLRNFDEFCTPAFNQIKVLGQQNQKLRAARDLLLPRLMSGEIAV